MDHETLELLKWLIAIPAAILVLLTVPYVMMKYHLECRKLRYEIWKLEESLGDQGKKARKEPGSVFSWMAHY